MAFMLFGVVTVATVGSDVLDEACDPNLFSRMVSNIKQLQYNVPSTNNSLEDVARGQSTRALQISCFAQDVGTFYHASVSDLLLQFLEFRRAHGTQVEKSLYQNMTTSQLVTRLLKNRPVVFMDADDQYELHTGQTGQGSQNFVNIGTSLERPPLVLSSYLSYAEMQVSALLGISVPTFFINDGGRDNRGVPAPPGTFEDQGVVVDQVGCRFERPQLMEWQHMVVTREQNTAANGYGRNSSTSSPLSMWSRLYNVTHFPTYAEAIAAMRAPGGEEKFVVAVPLPGGGHAPSDSPRGGLTVLNIAVFRARYRLQAIAFLGECSRRALSGSGAFCQVQESVATEPWWALDLRQALWMLQSFRQALATGFYPGVRVLNFGGGWNITFFKRVFPETSALRTPWGAVEVRCEDRAPASRLRGADEGLRVVYQFAGDSNAYAGNEFWLGEFGSSGDPAAAISSLLPWLQNRDVHPEFYEVENIEQHTHTYS